MCHYIDEQVMVKPVALNLKAVGGGQVDVTVLDGGHHVRAKGDILTHHLRWGMSNTLITPKPPQCWKKEPHPV